MELLGPKRGGVFVPVSTFLAAFRHRNGTKRMGLATKMQPRLTFKMTKYNGRWEILPVWGQHDTLRGGCLAFLPEHSCKTKSVTSTSKASCLIQKCHVCFSTLLKSGQDSGRFPVLRVFAHFCVRLLCFCVRFASNSARSFTRTNKT